MSFVFSGVVLLNWFTKSSKFEVGFNDNDNDHFLDLSTVCDVTISVSATSQKVFVAC